MIAAAEPVVVIAITPLLLFPTFRPAWTGAALALLVLVWVVRAAVRRETFPVTPFNAALLLFCLAIPAAVWASAAPELTIPKLTGLILGLAAFRVVAFSAQPGKPFTAATVIFLVLGLGMWALGLLGMRLPVLAPVIQRLPAALVNLPGSPDQGINPNQLAAILVLYLPFLMALIVLGLRERRAAVTLALAVVAFAGLATLVFTRSRSGWIGFAVAALAFGLMLVALEGSRRMKRVVLAGAAVALVAVLVAGVVLLPQQLGQDTSLPGGGQDVGQALQQLSLDARIEIWSRALYAMQDFPFTGVGLGTFRKVVNLLYPLFLVPPDQAPAHAHNIFLQTGVDLGIGGLIAYLALLLIGALAAWEAARHRGGVTRCVALGLLAALIGLHVYGLADALALGSKPGLAFWMVLGLLAALANGVGAVREPS